jgi:hypothetical protein
MVLSKVLSIHNLFSPYPVMYSRLMKLSWPLMLARQKREAATERAAQLEHNKGLSK